MEKFKIKKIIYADVLRYFITPIILFSLFKTLFDKWIAIYLVRPIFSACYPAKWQFDLIVFFIFFITVIPLLKKISRSVKIPFKWFCTSCAYLFIYITYRTENLFLFTHFSFYNHIALLDLLSLIPFIVCIISLTVRRHVNTIDITKGFEIDEPKTNDTNNDLLNRNKFIKIIAEKIKNTDSNTASFSIGVSAAWGAGKTTFLHTLESEFKNSDFIKIEFNVWRCASTNQINDVFFKLLRENLKEYSFTINNKLQDYTNILLKGTKLETLNTVRNFTELISPLKNLEEQFEIINSEIKKIGKKILVFIDDLDRLDKKEIYEVIRLIRNTANFSNIFFVVAYDRNYILNAIEEINTYQSHAFLENIFQLEFVLPPIEFKVLQSEIGKRIFFLTDKGKKEYEEMHLSNHLYSIDKRSDLTDLFVRNMRDVVRFVNSFSLSYQFVEDEIYLPDFYNLQLIKFKHPEIFAEIYRNKNNFLITERDKNIHSAETATYTLRHIEKTENNINVVSELAQFLSRQKPVYKLSDNDIEALLIAYTSIFPKRSIYGSYIQIAKSHLSVVIPSMFDRYFVLGIEGRLSEIEFSKLRGLQSSDFNSKIKTLCKDSALIDDLLARFEKIDEFDNIEDFRKLVSAIFYFANLPNPRKNNIPDYIGYNKILLCNLLNNDRRLQLLFDNDKIKLAKFILPFLETSSCDYSFTNDFVYQLLHDNNIYFDNLFSNHDISKILLQNFKNALDKGDRFTWFIWWHFKHCETSKKSLHHSGGWQTKYFRNELSLIPMRNFIFKKDIDGFIFHAIKQTDFGKYFVISTMVSEIFRSNEIFLRLLKMYKGDSKYKNEFINLYDKLSSVEEYKKQGVPYSFFNDIPIASN